MLDAYERFFAVGVPSLLLFSDDRNDADCPHPVQCSTPLAQHVNSGSIPGVSQDWQADLDSAQELIFSTPSAECIAGKGQLVERVLQPVLETPSKHEGGEVRSS